MDDMENYTSLQDFNEDTSSRGNRPILLNSQTLTGAKGVRRGQEYVRSRMTVVISAVLLISACANIALGVLLYNRPSVKDTALAGSVRGSSTIVRKYDSLAKRYYKLCEDYSSLAKNCTDPGVQVSQCKSCPDSWMQFEEKCYYFSKDKMNWEDSRVSCESMGSRLVILHSHRQHDALEDGVSQNKGFDRYFWIGLSDRSGEGDWRWVDNSPVNNTYWEVSQPDNHVSGGEHGEDCAVLHSVSKSWSDVPCEFLYNRICEIDAIEIDGPFHC